MATSTLTHDKLDDLLAHNDIVLIDFFTDWCGPCKVFAPVFEEASEKHPDVKFAKCNTEQEQQLAAVLACARFPPWRCFVRRCCSFCSREPCPRARSKI